MEYEIRRSLKAKRMRLSINMRGQLTLVLPRFVPEMVGQAFVYSNRLWVQRHQAKLALSVSDFQTQEFVSGMKLTFFDQKKYTIKISSEKVSKDFYKKNGEELVLYLGTAQPRISGSRQTRIKALIEQFYRVQAREYLTQRSEFFATQLNTHFNDLRIKNTKSRWGSCSVKKNLNYNWRIMLAPIKVIDYLVIHEVCHLVELNHSTRFWALVERFDPEYKIHKQWLKAQQILPLVLFFI